MRNFKKIIATFLSASFILSGVAINAYASELPEYIRVGLQMSYADKTAISIETTDINLVKTKKGDTNPLNNEVVAEFSSKSGFTVRVGLSSQVAVPIVANSLNEAKRIANDYIAKGYTTALPGYYKNNFAVIIYGYSDYNSAINAARELNGQALSANDVTILDINGDPVFLIANSDAYFESATSKPALDLGARSYRGVIDFMKNNDGTISAINIIDIEDYLYGVVAAEIPSSYEFEAIKAQACAARTYALYKYNRKSDVGYNICDSTHCQAYMGYDYEDATTRKAVDDTKGELIYYNGSPIEALFFSSSGGYTEDAVNVWGTDVPYLKAVDDSKEINCPTWTRTLTLSDLDKIITARGYNIGKATGMRITIDNKTKRVQKVEFLGTSGTKAITLEACRTIFNTLGESFKSRSYTITNGDVQGGATESVDKNSGTFISKPIENFKVDKNYVIGSDCTVVHSNSSDNIKLPNTGTTVITSKGSTIEIKGYGIGHGVGLSQMGANGMAKSGANYEDILKHYYVGVTIK